MHVDDAAAFGHYLRATRERQQITLELASHRTKIAARLLAALERGDISAWPPGLYRRAMMRAYADAIGMDREFAMEQFGRLLGRPAEPACPAEARVSARRRAAPRVHDPDSWMRHAAQLAGAAAVVAVVVAAFASAVRRVPHDATPVLHAETMPVAATRARRAMLPLPAPPALPALAMPAATAAPTETVPVEEPAPLAEEGRLAIESEPAGAVVTVNGIRRGVTPLVLADVPLGEKRVRLILDGYVSAERVAVLSPSRAAAVIDVTLIPRAAAERGSRRAVRGSADRH